MRRFPLSRVLTAMVLAGALAAPLSGCVAYPAYPGYGGYAYAPGYAYPCCAVGYYGHGGGYYGHGGGWYGGEGGGWHGGGWHR